MKIPTFLFGGVAGRSGQTPDTAIVEDGGSPTEMGGMPSTLMVDTVMGGAAPAPADSGRKLPLIGKLPLRKQVQVLTTTLAASLVIAFGFTMLDGRQWTQAALQQQVAGEALSQAQRAATAAPSALAGSPQAFRQLREARDAVGASVAVLEGGGRFAGSEVIAVGDEMIPEVNKLKELWARTEADTGKIVGQEKLLTTLGDARRQINASSQKMLEAAQQVAMHKVNTNAPAREVAAAGELVMLTQKLAKDVNQLLLGDTINVEAAGSLGSDAVLFMEITDNLLRGNERQRISPVSDFETRRVLAELKQTFADKVDQPLQLVVRELAKIQQAKQAEQAIFKDSEPIRLHLEAIRELLRKAQDASKINRYIAWFFGLIAILAIAGLALVYLMDVRKRTLEAERRKEDAERMEREAKRANDQNQAAILRLMNELQEVADGDLTVQATVSEDITGAIADSVNYTVEELRNLVARINSTAELVNEASSKAQMIASSLQAASEQQSREIRETGESVLRMAQQINEVSSRAHESVDVARKSRTASEDGAKAVQNAISGMNGIRDQIQETSKRIKRLGESSQEIGEIVELISDITEQTNVLALNAAIQAASAGEAGRGFTVVAEEVQRLAERSAEATKQISALIRTIQTDTQDAVAAMERSTQGVVEGTKLSDEAGKALGEIGRVSNQLAQLIEEFSSVTSKQAASAGTVAQSIQRILLVTEQTSEGTLQTAGSIRQLSELAQDLKGSVSRFKVS